MSANRRYRFILWLAGIACLLIVPSSAVARATYLLPTDFFGIATSGNEAWVCGANGAILHSGDRKTWEVQTSGTDENLSAIFFLNPKKGFCVGYHGTVLRTDDGGRRWVKVAVDAAYYLTGVFFASETAGFIVGEFGTLLATADGGATWKPVALGKGKLDVIFNDVGFAGPYGWIVGEFGTVMRTVDGGRTWKPVDIRMGEYMLFSVAVLDKSRVVITGADGLVLLTENGGASWKKVDLGVRNQVFGVHFDGPRDGYVFGKNILFRTGDGGRSFTKAAAGESLAYGWIYRMSGGLAVGDGGRLYGLADGKWSARRLSGSMNVSGGDR